MHVRWYNSLFYLVPPTEVSPATRPEEEEGGEVRDGRDDCGAADLHRLVPAALHVPRQVCGWSCQPAAGCLVRNHPGRLSGAATVSLIKSSEPKQVYKCFTEIEERLLLSLSSE